MKSSSITNIFRLPAVLRRLIISWLSAATISYIVLPRSFQLLDTVDGLEQMSFSAMCLMVCIFFIALSAWGYFHNSTRFERWLMVGIFAAYFAVSVTVNFRWTYFSLCCVIFLILIVYAWKGWDRSTNLPGKTHKSPSVYKILMLLLASCFLLFVSVWTVCRIYSFCTPTYDFGIFSQMFYNMKARGIPYTTVERDVMLSHFHVHVSPIYYLLLPIYYLFPFPATLQVLQAVILASSVVPLWLLCRRHGLKSTTSLVICAVLLLYPAFSGGTSYDIHENAFLAPCILWLLFGFDSRNTPITIIFGCLTLLIKEDAAVYVVVIALYITVRSALRSSTSARGWELFMGSVLLLVSVFWFLIVTRFLASSGDGVMTYRYQNFMTDNEKSLLSVVKSVILCPAKLLYECTDPEKLKFTLLTLLPLLLIPFFTRKYDRYILLIPYILINLMSDYPYQHDIFFQYTFGSTACLLYLTVVNLSDIKSTGTQTLSSCICLILSLFLFVQNIVPVAVRYPRYIKNNGDKYRSIRQTLAKIPQDATVAATTFYTTELSQREILYDVKYTSTENLLSAEYIALAIHSATNYRKYETDGINGFENLVSLLEANNYSIFAQLDDTLVIYKKQ